MAFLEGLLGKKKKTLSAHCRVSHESIEPGFGYLLTTAQVVASPKYWDLVMTEPEMLSYTVSHFNNKTSGTQMRSLVFEKYSSVDKPWMVSDTCINLFDVNRDEARDRARQWWESEGHFAPERCGPALETLDEKLYNKWKDYAILEAGRARVQLARG